MAVAFQVVLLAGAVDVLVLRNLSATRSTEDPSVTPTGAATDPAAAPTAAPEGEG